MLTRVRRWRELLLEQPVDPALAAELPEFLKQTAHEFLIDVPLAFSNAQVNQLSLWYESTAGQGALVAFASALWGQMSDFAADAMPGHDARHAMYKVPAACLEYIMAEGVHGWERVGLLGALLHDHGRWAEERIFGWPGASVIHARLSYLLGRELLESFEMPAFIKQHILLAAIRHTSGALPTDPMPLKLTVSADRDQLYGPEIILRMAHHAVGRQGGGSSYYGERPGKTVLDQLERFLTHRLPGPLFSRATHVQNMWQVLADFLMLAESADASRQRFERFLAERGGSAATLCFDWKLAYERLEAFRDCTDSPREALERFLSVAHIAPSPEYWRAAIGKVDALSQDNGKCLAAALAYADQRRRAFDAAERESLARIARFDPSDGLMRCLTRLLGDAPSDVGGVAQLDEAGALDSAA